jgi:hypothetical protein
MVYLDQEHGLNPGIELCFFCNKDKGIILFGSALRGQEAPRQAVYNHEPCDSCANLMKQGVILISVDEKKSAGDMQNPWRTGGWVVVKDEYIKRVFNPPELVADVLNRRIAFMPDETWDLLQLPRSPSCTRRQL